jgi:DNA polymerase V
MLTKIEPSQSIPIVLFECAVQAGFPSPAADHAQKRIDLNEHLLQNRESSFLFRVKGNSMQKIGIHPGDTIIVDKALPAKHGSIVLAIVDNEFTVKRLDKRGQCIRLLSENDDYAPIEFKEGQELRIWGVVTFNLRNLMRA